MTADWYGNRRGERYIYRRVKWDWDAGTLTAGPRHFHEIGEYGNVTRGSVSLSAFTDIRASCQFDYDGGELPDTTDLVRIYYRFEDDAGESAEACIGTFFVEYGDTTYTDADGELMPMGTVNGSSVLSLLANRKLGAPYTVAAGTDNIAEADAIVKGLGLYTNDPVSEGQVTQSAHTFEAEDSYLTVVNWLLTNNATRYASAYPDAKGRVMMVPYKAPETRTPVATFRADGRSIMLPELAQENDWQSTPNVARLWYEGDDECLYAVARCLSGSRASLASRGGREVTMTEAVTELAGETQAERIEALEAMAAQRLIDQSTEIEKATITHAFIDGVQPNDAVTIEYGGRAWAGNVTNMDISLEISTPCSTQLRRFIPNSLNIEPEGGALWTA